MREYKLFHRFNPPPKVIVEVGEGGADQSFKDECDINKIMDRYSVTGVMGDPNAVARRVAQFMDVSGAPTDLLEAQLIVAAGEEALASLPSSLRNKFGNDVGAMLEFVSNPANRDEAVKLGLIEGAPTSVRENIREDVKTPPRSADNPS